jgi:hypothetical protein
LYSSVSATASATASTRSAGHGLRRRAALSVASQAGFKCFTDVGQFKRYVVADILAAEEWS